MTANKLTPERRATGKHVKLVRQSLGYNRKRFGKMLGFTDRGAKRNMAQIEGGMKKISVEKWALIELWTRYGLPSDAPEPNLHLAKQKYFEIKRAENTPRVIELRGK